MDCHFSVWGVLAFLSLALVVSLILNISHYMKKKQEECCYEQMKSQPQRPVNQLQVESANQMCYASLDHSVKGKCRKPRRKAGPSLEKDEEERSSKPTTMASKVSIYLNSEQLAAENTANIEAIHDDPIRLMGLIHTTRGENI
uniref:T cell receptor associated transmembrane adaptor 1 n=1 Tax=Buteo japonicus TaxID=224669 RepID=A0A8B9Z4U7_9AVES